MYGSVAQRAELIFTAGVVSHIDGQLTFQCLSTEQNGDDEIIVLFLCSINVEAYDIIFVVEM